VLLLFADGLWDGQELTSAEPPPEWISIGATGRYTLYDWDAASPNDEGRSTAYYVWAHADMTIGDPDQSDSTR
jgi:hypothetical protein